MSEEYTCINGQIMRGRTAIGTREAFAAIQSLTAENAALRERLAEAEGLLKALRLGLRDHSDAAMATDAFLARDTEKNDA